MTVLISVQNLYEAALPNPYNNKIDVNITSKENEIQYFDLYNESDELACMDGEECSVVEEDNHHVVLGNSNGDYTVYFTLSRKEFEIAICK